MLLAIKSAVMQIKELKMCAHVVKEVDNFWGIAFIILSKEKKHRILFYISFLFLKGAT